MDFLLARGSGVLYVNELNTLPGFTTIGMYSKLWAATGLGFPALIERLIDLALERHAEQAAIADDNVTRSRVDRSNAVRRALVTAGVFSTLFFHVSPVTAALTEAPRLAAVYASVLAAQFDRAETQLAQACPPAPMEACASLGVVALWWQIQLAPESTRLDARFSDLAAKAVAAAEKWTGREPNRGEAWFYLAGSYAPLVQWLVLRGERIAAARDGKKIKDALERALQLDPSLDDAYFGIGLYHYYADVAPATAKILRWLLFLPGGDRVKGLQEMLQARQRGVLLNGEADYQLHLIYLWCIEQQPTRAARAAARARRALSHEPRVHPAHCRC